MIKLLQTQRIQNQNKIVGRKGKGEYTQTKTVTEKNGEVRRNKKWLTS